MPDYSPHGLEENSDATVERPVPDEKLQLPRRSRNARNLLILVAGLGLATLLAVVLWPRDKKDEKEKAKETAAAVREPNEITLAAEALAAAGIETVEVAERTAVEQLVVSGSVEANAERAQLITPLVSGRLATVSASLGQRVGRGAVLATIESPQVAELRGQLLEANSKFSLASANVARVRQTANRAGVISARAKLDLADKALTRQRRLHELGGIALKDLQAAEAAYATAKAEYDYQADVALSREVQTAESERDAARATVDRLRQGLLALGGDPDQPRANSALAVTAPITGTVIKREVNAGAGVKEGDTLFAIADLSTVWVIANVPEAQSNHLRVGAPALIRGPALVEATVSGRISYIDSQLNNETHTVRIRVEVANPGERLKVGMFVEVSFQGRPSAGLPATELAVPSQAVQRIGERTVVFVAEEGEPGHFQVRDVELGGEAGGYRRVINGLKAGQRVVTKGTFALKSQLLKGQLEEDDKK
jgi:cobalt-zinc-cadmium efflux system membrane fusion protein